MPRLPWRQAAAGSARCSDRRQVDHRSYANDDCAGRRLFCGPRSFSASRLPSPREFWPRFATGWICSSGSAWTTLRWIASLPRFPAANPSGFSWRHLWDPRWSERSMFWMNRASDFIRETASGWWKFFKSLKALGNTVLVVEHDPEIMRSADHIDRSGTQGGRTWRRGGFSGKLSLLCCRIPNRLPADISSGELKIPVPIFRRKTERKKHRASQCLPAQSEASERPDSARNARLHHGRQRQRKIHSGS